MTRDERGGAATESPTEEFLLLPKLFVKRSDLSAAAKLVLFAIRDRIGKNSGAWPGHPKIAADVGLSESTVRRAIRALKLAKLLDTSSRGPGKSLLYKSSNLDQNDPGQNDPGDKNPGQNDLRGGVKMTHGVGQIDLIENQTNELDQLNQTNERSTKMKPTKFPAEAIERIYAAYPRKIAKGAALKVIAKVLRAIAKRGTPEPVEWLLKRVEKFAASPLGDLKTKPDTPYPASWFNGGRYDDPDSEWLKTWSNTSGSDRKRREFPEPAKAARRL